MEGILLSIFLNKLFLVYNLYYQFYINMKVTINNNTYSLKKNPYLPNNPSDIFVYKSDLGSILIYLWILDTDELCKKLKEYFYGRKKRMLENQYLLDTYRLRNIESWLLEMDFSLIPDFPEFIVDFSIQDNEKEKYQIIDIDLLSWIEDWENPGKYIWMNCLLKMRKLNYFTAEVEKIRKMSNLQDSIGLAHGLIEMIVSDLCRKNHHIPTTNFKSNLDNSIITDENIKNLLTSIKKISWWVAHWNTSTPESKKDIEQYHGTIIQCLVDVVKQYY